MARKKTKKKKVKKYKKKKLKKIIYRKKVKTSQTDKSDNERKNVLRISKSYDQKIEIEKIKKQATEKRIFKINEYVVYPKHGVGQIMSVDSKIIGGIEVQCYEIKFEKDKAVGLLPINKQSHLRPLSSINQINKKYSEIWPNINQKKNPPADSDNFRNEKNKYDKYFKENIE